MAKEDRDLVVKAVHLLQDKQAVFVSIFILMTVTCKQDNFNLLSILIHSFLLLKSYLVGTEDGHIHRCSCSYNEQYLHTQFGHTGPVYKVKWSPFLPGTYLSCSADWTVRLWGMDDEESSFKFQSGKVNCDNFNLIYSNILSVIGFYH